MTNEIDVINKKKAGIYIWHVKNEQKYCIGYWDPAGKSYYGLSEYNSAKQRIEHSIKAKDGAKQLSMSDVVIDFAKVLDFYNPDNRTSSFDKIIHSNLIKFFGRDCQVATEIFELSKEYKNPKDIFIDAVEKTASNEWEKFDPSRPYNYNPRKGSQDEAIKAVKAAVKNNCRKFLLGCKCRFGKTFTSYEIAKELGFNNILIMTFRPGDTKEAWKSDLNSHQHFKDYTFFGQDEIEEFSNHDGNKVLFISFQKAKISSDFEAVKQIYFDMVIIDEDQIGAHRINNRNLIEELDKNFTLVLTGTPELEIMSNEFGDDFYKFDYIDEQTLKENPDTKEFYADMPKLEIYSFDLSNKFVDTIKDLDGFSLAEFFKVENDKFVYAAYVNKFLDYLSMQIDSADELPDCSLGIFANPDFDMSHGLWKLPSIKACRLLKELLNKHKFFKDYDVEVLPESDKSPKQIEKKCHEGKPTIWLTVMKNTVGVTVKSWTYTISLYGSDNSSLSSYIQFIFRAGSPGKDVFRTFDFCPSRVLDVVDMFAVARCADKTNDDYQAAITKVVNYLPVFAYNNAGGFERLTPNEIFKQIANFTTVRSCRNLLYKEFDLLSDYADSVESIQVQSFNPTVTKNEALKKLKKELLKKAENKKKSETEKSENKDFIEKMFQAFIDIYTWVKYDKGIDDIDDFLEKIESYSDDFEEWFGFSDEFMNAFVEVISSSKKNFGIAIERFKMMPFKFAMEDVPETLAEKMLDKFSKKRDLIDAACKGPTLLKMANKRWPDIKLFAYNADGISKRLKRILEKEVPSVNIIKELRTDMNVIMNPPYNGNLHLKIIDKLIRACPNSEIVNLSPIRWLHDPLAEYKKNSDYNRFENIRNHIESFDVIKAEEASQIFQALVHGDLGIYKITNDGGWVKENFYKSIIDKVYSCEKHWNDVVEHDKIDGIRVKTQKLRNSAPSSNSTIKVWQRNKSCYHLMYKRHSCIFNDGKQDEKWWTEFDIKNKYSRNIGDPLVDSIKFDTYEEAKNFEDSCWTKFMLFCNKISKVGVNSDFRFLPFMPTYKHKWTDKDLYDFFELTPEEVNIIENEIK